MVLYPLAGVGGARWARRHRAAHVGGGRGEARLVASVEIARPAESCSLDHRARGFKSWVGWLVEIRSLTPARGVGSRDVWVMEDRNNNNQRMDVNAEVTRSSRTGCSKRG